MSFKDRGARIHVSLSLVLLLCGLLCLGLGKAENANPVFKHEFSHNYIEDGTATGKIAAVLEPTTNSSREPKLFLPFFIRLDNKSKFKPTKTPAKTTAPTTRTGNIQIADKVATLIHNAIRITHGVPPLTFSPTLKRLAQSCADYHATQGTDLEIAPGPEKKCALITADVAESWSYFPIPPLSSESQLYRGVLWDWYLHETDPNYAAPAYDFANRHKVQMIWKSTTMYACAKSSISYPLPPVGGVTSRIYVSCLYNPPGNDQVTPNAFPMNVFRDSI